MKISSIASGSGGTQLSGVFIAKDGCPFSVYTLSWEKPTIFKPYQEVVEGNLQPWQDPNDPDSISNWLYIIPNVVRAAGTIRKVTFCTEIPKAEEGLYTESPYARFFRVIKELSRQDTYKQNLEPLFKGGAGSGAVIPKVAKIGVMQGTLYMHNGKDMSSNPRPNVMLLLTPSATNSLASLITLRDPEGNPIVGDIFSESPTKMFHFSKSTDGVLLPQRWENIAEVPTPPPAPGQMQTASHACRLVQAPSNISVAGPGMNIQNWQNWEDVLSTRSVQEQISILCTAYEPWLLQLVFVNSEFEEMLPTFVRRPGTVVSAPTAPPQQQNSMVGQFMANQNKPATNKPFAMPMQLGPSQEEDVDDAGTAQPVAAQATTLPPAGAVNQQTMEASKAKLQGIMAARGQPAAGFVTPGKK